MTEQKNLNLISIIESIESYSVSIYWVLLHNKKLLVQLLAEPDTDIKSIKLKIKILLRKFGMHKQIDSTLK